MADHSNGIGFSYDLIAQGLQLSSTLLGSAKTAGSMAPNIRHLGADISLFCSVLKQVHLAVANSGMTKYSVGSRVLVQKIVRRCQKVFTSLDQIVDWLGPDGNHDEGFLAKADSVFGRSHCQILRKMVEACTITLHILLHNLEVARCLSTRN